LVLGAHALELATDLLELAGGALVDQHEHEVAQQLVAAGEQVLQGGASRARVKLRVAQELAQLGNLFLGRDDLRELLAHGRESVLFERGIEQRPRIHTIGDAQSTFSRTERSSSLTASSIRR